MRKSLFKVNLASIWKREEYVHDCLFLPDQAAKPNIPSLYPFFVTLDWLDLQIALSDLHHSCNSLAEPDNLAEYFALTCDVLPRRVSSP
jgi:hypothetical protein